MGHCVPLFRHPFISFPSMRSPVSFPKLWVTSHIVLGILCFQNLSAAGERHRTLAPREAEEGGVCCLLGVYDHCIPVKESLLAPFFNLWLLNLASLGQSSLKV